MKHLALVASLLFASACAAPLPSEGVETAVRGSVIGEPLEPGPVHRYADVARDPESWQDQTLLVEADVVAVCLKKGCWMQIEDGGSTALVRWEEGCGGRYAFPADAVGKRIRIQGSFYPKELSDEDREHLEEEAGGDVRIPARGWELNASAVVLLAE
jgi:hypothetical protein